LTHPRSIGGVGLARDGSGDGRRRGGRRSAAVAAMPASRWVGRPMRVHGRVQGVRVEASVVLGLEEGRWKVERTSKLRPSAGGDGRRCGAALCYAQANAREEGVRGARRGLGRLAWAHWAHSCCACNAGRARAACDGGAAQLPWHGHLARPEARGHLARCGRGRQHASWAHGVAVRPKVRRPGWSAEARRRRDVATRVRRRV
jgi:hypothetical protein